MKNKWTLRLLVSVLAVSLLASCKKDPDKGGDEPDPVLEPTEIGIKATARPQGTRLSYDSDLIKSSWSENDKMSVYLQYDQEWFNAEEYSVKPGSLSNDNQVAIFTGPLEWQMPRMTHRVYAYAPKVVGDEDPTTIPVSLPAVQTQDGLGYTQMNPYNVMVAHWGEAISPESFEESATNDPVELEFQSIFSILEFRIASHKETGLKIKKIEVESNNRALAVTNGRLDITQTYYDPNFAIIREGTRSNKVTLNITNPVEVPISEKKYFIQGNSALAAANTDLVFPARVMILPNENTALDDEDVTEEWKVTITADLINDDMNRPDTVIERTMSTRRIRPGERHALTTVIITSDELREDDTPEEIGTPWSGWDDITMPTIDHTEKVIEIRRPSELAWMSRAIARKITAGVPANNPRFKKYTMKILENINLNGHPWEPIGTYYNPADKSDTTKYFFEGNITGRNEEVWTERSRFRDTTSLISGLFIEPTNLSSDLSYDFGLFGYINNSEISCLRVDCTINITRDASASSMSIWTGPIVGFAASSRIYACGSTGTMGGYLSSSAGQGGIVGITTSGASVENCTSEIVMNYRNVASMSTSQLTLGGIVGDAGGTIKACEYTGSITVSGNTRTGGITGYTGSPILACRTNATIINDEGVNCSVGGIVGATMGAVRSSYARGYIRVGDGASSSNWPGAGGIVGSAQSNGQAIQGCYYTGLLETGTTMQIKRCAGNIIGGYYVMGGYTNFSNIKNNYFVYAPQPGDVNDGLAMGAVTQFSPSAWPDPVSMKDAGWGTGDGSDNNKLWNTYFPESYGTGEYEYPQLYWEVIE